MTALGAQHADSNTIAKRSSGVLVVAPPSLRRDGIHRVLAEVDTPFVTIDEVQEAESLLQAGFVPVVICVVEGVGVADLCGQVRADLRLTATQIVVVAEETSPQSSAYLLHGADHLVLDAQLPHLLQPVIRAALRRSAQVRCACRMHTRQALTWFAAVFAHEINNPLAVALMSVEDLALESNTEHAPQSNVDLRAEALHDATDSLKRIGNFTQSLQKAGPRAAEGTSRVDAQGWVRDLLSTLRGNEAVAMDRLSVQYRGARRQATLFAAELMRNAAIAIIAAGMQRCTGAVLMTVSYGVHSVAVTLHFEGCPDGDPEELLEARLVHDTLHTTPHYSPGLGHIEDGFSSLGGQIFARPEPQRWCFGLKLPVTRAP